MSAENNSVNKVMVRQALDLTNRIAAAGAIKYEADNFESWKKDARALAPILRAALTAQYVTSQEIARKKLQQTWDIMPSLPPLIFSESEADHLIATIAAFAIQEGYVATLRNALAPFAKAGEIVGLRGEYSDFFAYRPAAGDDYAITGDHLRAATAALAGTATSTPITEDLRSLMQEAHDMMHECTAVMTANDCSKVAAVMTRIRAALAT